MATQIIKCDIIMGSEILNLMKTIAKKLDFKMLTNLTEKMKRSTNERYCPRKVSTK